ncbi:hypothetical protein QCD60_17590 [Pokkaliibacter sp. MBI-7]|uniref:hypothetical protein n=1 Tax=Pokkaliibacter sp. MBI-7 TaxID=3040600 RepID=UPI00244B828B|nr:hypothetical protein [Pokkaliibacter sp. MBI-7]MDH2434375.1 hypothetical protein [Pokkaliibacter sp. MBI-7]
MVVSRADEFTTALHTFTCHPVSAGDGLTDGFERAKAGDHIQQQGAAAGQQAGFGAVPGDVFDGFGTESQRVGPAQGRRSRQPL